MVADTEVFRRALHAGDPSPDARGARRPCGLTVSCQAYLAFVDDEPTRALQIGTAAVER